ncbi:MAG: rhomboid family intramembrane serine protease [Haloarculaceae archaeon]
MRSRLTDSPTVKLVAALVAVFVLQIVVGTVGNPRGPFALSADFTRQPWTLVTSVFAHSSLSHLVANAVGLAVVGLLLERQTSPARLYAFFVVTGALSGLTEVSLAALLGPWLPGMTARVSVLGASGAIFALLGYLLTSNRLTETVVGGMSLSPRVQLAIFGTVAVLITILTAEPQVALIAHFTGLLLGLLAGRAHLLRPDRTDSAPATV